MSKTEIPLNHPHDPFVFESEFDSFLKSRSRERVIVITDENLLSLYRDRLAPYEVIAVPAGESNKNQHTVDRIFSQLIEWEADRETLICGLGGGVITDIAGYVASVFKRGLPLGLVPTTVLGMVDAALGGKNGINLGMAKNMIGSIYQPQFILFDLSFLKTLPEVEWQSGFAEIIKHACIRDTEMFEWLERDSLEMFRQDDQLLRTLIRRNVNLKMQIVSVDPYDQYERLLLNFGHTLGHAIENLHQLPHGHAISIGMRAAALLSRELNFLSEAEVQRLVQLLQRYHLPTMIKTDEAAIMQMIRQDKKRKGNDIRFVLLDQIGHGFIQSTSFSELEQRAGRLLC